MFIRLTPYKFRAGFYNISQFFYLCQNEVEELKEEYPTIVGFLDGKEIVVKEKVKTLVSEIKDMT